MLATLNDIHDCYEKKADEARTDFHRPSRILNRKQKNIMTCSFQMACRIIEALEMNISDFYHNEYIIGEEIYMDSEGEKYKKTGKLISEDVE